jgi:hypothetical protein
MERSTRAEDDLMRKILDHNHVLLLIIKNAEKISPKIEDSSTYLQYAASMGISNRTISNQFMLIGE